MIISRTSAAFGLAIRDEVLDLEGAGIGMIRSTNLPCVKGCRCGTARLGCLPRPGGRLLPAHGLGRRRREADPHPYVLRRVQRHHAGDLRARCRRDLDRNSRSDMELIEAFRSRVYCRISTWSERSISLKSFTRMSTSTCHVPPTGKVRPSMRQLALGRSFA